MSPHIVERIDVGLLSPPRPRTIFLEPISKRARRKKAAPTEKPSASGTPHEITDLASEADSSVVTEDSARGENTNNHHQTPGDARGGTVPSDVRSEISGESGRSLSATGRPEHAHLSQIGSTLTSAAKQQVVDDKTITATIELLKGGCLPGEAVTVRVAVQHIKRIKSMTGVIVTLFRQSRIDLNPPDSPSFEASQSKNRLHKDEPYPRFRTGLIGLSLSSAGSTSVFRKDLDQNAAPLIIDPATLQASVTVSVRVPDDAFPTIRGVPGEMISFKYHVEVIVDLGGKLTSQLGVGFTPSRFGTSGGSSNEPSQGLFGPQRGSNVADTSQVKRQKGVISVSLETVVGTIDSGRSRPHIKPGVVRQAAIRIAEAGRTEVVQHEVPGHSGTLPYGSILTNGNPHLSSPNRRLDDYTAPPPHPSDIAQHRPWSSAGLSRDFAHVNGAARSQAAPCYIPPPPQIPDQANMTEKERIQQAEARLLPSQPPVGPSTAEDEEDLYDAEDTPQGTLAGPVVPTVEEVEARLPAPLMDEAASGRPTEDKQELERQRLLQEASAPPEFPEDMDTPASSSSARDLPDEPTAPHLDEDAESYVAYGAVSESSRAGGSEQLPAYQR
ncbi:hypothetical protein UVI_02055330 [Ustilaginoidea virens]|uniref:Arrestin C-terminal-like domain-containing protein n=1 Tax=Ustilaginoidea virens TaxID=1159556 RepID=A0A1B5KTX4_USTVR|nr:hypothetical protein UVI_02055330 [Ustilaginoidea virens]